ncbi:hypothetical protein [uncultured Cohaesibacter sp.]|uniref:hypothetical protein n=1 Tax=uncultured Cohaesibacter sp. TaxID=1002546 RepID=UPI002AABC249|nr:hypothetical protein [uncultured Cohaesibacter sp.]
MMEDLLEKTMAEPVKEFKPRIAQLKEICSKIKPGTHHVSLVEAISTILPDLSFRYRTTLSGWYRLGGLVDDEGNRIATNLRQWAEAESDHDMFALYEQYGGADYYTTRLDGKCHYFVAPTGKGAADFVQLKVEEMTEVIDRPLFVNDLVPDDLEDLLDPQGAFAARVAPTEIAPPRYVFHSITDISALVSNQLSSEGSDLRYIRFLEEWGKTTASSKQRFSDHFVLKLLPFLDRFGERKTEATPVPVKKLPLPSDNVANMSGTSLSHFLKEYDKNAGFPMAWYFNMLVEQKIWPQIATAVYMDHQRNYRYLADKDLEVLENWIRFPYVFGAGALPTLL